ncbi:nose resistant to fluoxetine protein 6-like [Drosophila ananassae]|uniref:nose resistant to fluoxetine protein 6-like n=1 Tax=Drosophila ananassae TaxID=7217 RepID=UPI0013A5BFC5|nr:nose resistant to fluoxetine protein 6-like [Drosophila ananassae]
MVSTIVVMMVSALGALFFCGLVFISSAEPNEKGFQQDLQRLNKLNSLKFEFVNYFQNASLLDVIPYAEEDSTEQELQCMYDLMFLALGVSNGEYWAFKMFDSWGKIPSGILRGNLYELGNFDECLNTKNILPAPFKNITGKYCFLSVTPSLLLGSNNPLAAAVKLNIGTCFPSSCRASHMNNFLKTMMNINTTISVPGIGISDSSCQTLQKEPWDGLTKASIWILVAMAAIVALFTVVDYFLRKVPEELPAIVKIFSARANSRALFRVTETTSNPNVIECIHGIRCMTLFWVIFSHEYVDSLITANLNLVDFFLWAEEPYASFVLHSFFSVDSFFVIGGMLVSLITLRIMERSDGKLNVLLMYLHRLIRIWPLMALAILIYMKLMPVVADGPLFKDGYSGLPQCEAGWYWSLIFVQNYVSNKCVGHTWYLAVDMQLFILSPIFLFALYKWGKKAAAGIVVLVLLLSACLFATMMVNDYSMLMKRTSVDAMANMYYATHTHAAPWLIGFLFGYFLHLNRAKKFQLNWMIVGLGWILSLAMIFTSIFALYPSGKWIGASVSILGESFYHTFTRIGWPLALCWVIFACMQGYGGLANSFLSSPLWQPLSRLSYSIFIWHLFIVEVNARNVRTNVYFSNYQMMLKFWSDLGITILVSYVLHLIFEAPFSSIGEYLKPGIKNLKATNEVEEEKTDAKKSSSPMEHNNFAPDSETNLVQQRV